MKRTFALLLAIGGFLTIAPMRHAQDKFADPPIPSRYKAIAKSPHTRLLEVCGAPEVQPAFAHTAAYAQAGTWSVFASNVPTGDEHAPLAAQLFVWDVKEGRLVKEIQLNGRGVTALALSADGKHALLGAFTINGKNKDLAYPLVLVDLAAGKEVRSFGSHPNSIFGVTVAADGKRALSGTHGCLQHWDLTTGKQLTRFTVPKDTLIGAVAYLPDGKSALTGWNDEVRLWDLATGKPELPYKRKAPAQSVLAIGVSADGKRFVSAHSDMTASLWNTQTAQELAAWARPVTAQNAPLPAEPIVVDGGKSAIVCWGFPSPVGNPREPALVVRFDDAGKDIWSRSVPMQGMVPIRLNGKTLLLGGGANAFCVWDAADGKELRRWGGPKGPISALAQAATGELLSASNDGLIYRCTRGQQHTAWRAHDAAINAMAVSKDRKLLLTASADKTVRLHDVTKGVPICTLTGHSGNVTSVAFGPMEHWAASGSDDRTVILWDLKAGKKRHTLEGHAEAVNAVAIAPQGDWLASASDDNTVRVWPIKDGRPDADRDIIALDAHTRQVTSVAFSSDGKRLLSAGQDQTIKLWDLAEQKVVREFKGHTNWITAAAFATSDRVLSASDDLTVRLWDVQTGQELQRVDLSAVADGPRSLLALGDSEFAVGTSGWVVLRFGLTK